jgi:AcrR family transcriptional regulator
VSRAYDSPVRRERAAATREGIVAAGADLLHESPIWNWHALTVRAVAQRAGVSERTVYRHFTTERDLRDAVLRRLEEEAGIDLRDGLALEDVAPLTRRLFEFVSSFPIAPRTPRDETVSEANERQRRALLDAVAPHAGGRGETDRVLAAAVLDVLWSVVSYERIVVDWDVDPKDAIRGLTWAIGLVEAAVRSGDGPGA